MFMAGILICNSISCDSLTGLSNYFIDINDCSDLFETCSITFKEIYYTREKRIRLSELNFMTVHQIQHSSYISPNNFSNITLNIPFVNIHRGLYIYTNNCSIDNIKSLKLSISYGQIIFDFNAYMICKFCEIYKNMLFLPFNHEKELDSHGSTINFSRTDKIALQLTFKNETNDIDVFGYSMNKYTFYGPSIKMEYSTISGKQNGTYTLNN